MRSPADPDWPRRLRPLVLDGTPLVDQLRRRLGAAVVASGLLVGLALFFLILFAGFGRAGIGLAVAAPLTPVLARIWADHRRLRRAVGRYVAAMASAGAAQPPAGATAREVDPGR